MIAVRRVNSRMPIGESGLRREVAIDLVNLLNTTNLAACEDLDGLDEVKRSILNYGFPDLSCALDRRKQRRRTAARDRDRARRFRAAAGAQVSIRVKRDETALAEDLKLRFLIKAELRVDPIDTPIEFAAEVDLDSGKVKIDRLVAMNREFLEFYNRELRLLQEQAAEFAAGISRHRRPVGRAGRRPAGPDDRRPARRRGVPGRARATQAEARILRIHHQPDRPTGAAISRADAFLRADRSAPDVRRPRAARGAHDRAGAYLDATYRESTRNVACRFRLAAPITLWPFEIAKAEYLARRRAAAGAWRAGRRRMRGGPAAAPRRARRRRGSRTSRPTRTPSRSRSLRSRRAASSACDFICSGAKPTRWRCTSRCSRIAAAFTFARSIRSATRSCIVSDLPNARARSASPRTTALIAATTSGCSAASTCCAIISRFPAVSSASTSAASARSRRELNAKIGRRHFRVRRAQSAPCRRGAQGGFSLYAAPAVNLFEKRLDRIPVKSNSTNIMSCPTAPARSTSSPTGSQSVFAHIPGVDAEGAGRAALFRGGRTQRLRPHLHGAPPAAPTHRAKSANTARSPTTSAPTCSCRWASVGDPEDLRKVAELSVEALVHQPPSGRASAGRRGRRRFPLLDDVDIDVRCVAGPTRPREPRADLDGRQDRRRDDRRGRLAADQHAEPQPSGPGRPRPEAATQGRCAKCSGCSPTSPTARPSARLRGVRGARRQANRAARAQRARRRRGARPRNHGHARRKGVRRLRRVSASARCSTASSSNTSRSTISPRPSCAPTSAAKSCAGRRALAGGASHELPLGDSSRALALRFVRDAAAARARSARQAAHRRRATRAETSSCCCRRIPILNFPPRRSRRRRKRRAGGCG